MIRLTHGCAFLLLLWLGLGQSLWAQRLDPQLAGRELDPCGLPDTNAAGYRLLALTNWGYGYDSLLADLQRWKSSPYVRVDSIGASVLNRTLYRLTIEDTTELPFPRKRVWIHARTHPSEVQGTWVTNQMIALLLSDGPLGRRLRDSCIFNIVPMYNPDGVELSYLRENAHGVDLESNWAAVPGEPEVQVLRAQFNQLMAQPNPIRLALNVQSAVACTRYFVYHDIGGTSALYASMERNFIGLVQSYFPGGIQPYPYFVSWTTGAPTYYPESWFWYNCHENVLALTYEDMNCASAGGFDSTAYAILHGLGDYLGVTTGMNAIAASQLLPSGFRLDQNFPNPFNPTTVIRYSIPAAGAYRPASGLGGVSRDRMVRLAVYDLLGREVAELVNERQVPGSYEVRFNAAGLASGSYFCRIQVSPGVSGNGAEFVETRAMLLLR